MTIYKDSLTFVNVMFKNKYMGYLFFCGFDDPKAKINIIRFFCDN